MTPLLQVRDLSVEFGPVSRPVHAVTSVDLTIDAGEILGIAGESGSGKSTLCAAMIRALPTLARVTGDVTFGERDLFALSATEMRSLRGREIAMVLQNPMTSLDPLFSIGDQLGEVIRRDTRDGRAATRQRALERLRAVHLTAPETRLGQYPHELSGGMRQRILIAMATATSPRLLIADEPTTALDVTIQEEILALFQEIRERNGTAIVIVTHDLGIIRRSCDRILIMYAGRIVEEGPVQQVFETPRHPYTRALLAAIPAIDDDRTSLATIPGQVPNLAELPPGCAFAERCPQAGEDCRNAPPERWTGEAHRYVCWRSGTL